MSARRPNFSAGPAVMPEPVLRQIRDDIPDWRDTGASVMETSHRSAAFVECAAEAEADLRALLHIPDDYSVLFMQGGATMQFALTVMNLAAEGSVAFADTGIWSAKALRTASGLVRTERATGVVRDERGRWIVPPAEHWSLPDDAAYLHVCDNETIDGIALDDATYDAIVARAPHLPIVADFSSSILSRPIDVSRFALIYAGAQKNIGPAGLTLVIASPEAMARSRRAADLPGVFSYAAMADAGSMLNTPPTFAWYAAGLVFRWLLEQGGLASMQERNRAQAERVYATIDATAAYRNDVDVRFRSLMNLPFSFADDSTTSRFLDGAAAAGLLGLKGHKSVGGARASLYNALPDTAVDALIAYMRAFEA